MRLLEFFGNPVEVGDDTADKSKQTDDKELRDELFWFIVDHDRLFKEYVYPLANKIKQNSKSAETAENNKASDFMPMTKKGCMEFFYEKKMHGAPKKIFNKDLRDELCEKLYNHFREDIIKDHYMLGK